MPFTLILYIIYDCKSWHELNGKHIIYDSNWIMTANTNHELEAPIYRIYRIYTQIAPMGCIPI